MAGYGTAKPLSAVASNMRTASALDKIKTDLATNKAVLGKYYEDKDPRVAQSAALVPYMRSRTTDNAPYATIDQIELAISDNSFPAYIHITLSSYNRVKTVNKPAKGFASMLYQDAQGRLRQTKASERPLFGTSAGYGIYAYTVRMTLLPTYKYTPMYKKNKKGVDVWVGARHQKADGKAKTYTWGIQFPNAYLMDDYASKLFAYIAQYYSAGGQPHPTIVIETDSNDKMYTGRTGMQQVARYLAAQRSGKGGMASVDNSLVNGQLAGIPILAARLAQDPEVVNTADPDPTDVTQILINAAKAGGFKVMPNIRTWDPILYKGLEAGKVTAPQLLFEAMLTTNQEWVDVNTGARARAPVVTPSQTAAQAAAATVAEPMETTSSAIVTPGFLPALSEMMAETATLGGV